MTTGSDFDKWLGPGNVHKTRPDLQFQKLYWWH